MKQILLLAFACVNLMAADATGKWTGTLTPWSENAGSGPGDRPAHLILKQDGSKLSGSAGPNESQQFEIQKGKAENGTLTFELAIENAILKANLKIEGDEIKGEITRERDGQQQKATLAVKRDK